MITFHHAGPDSVRLGIVVAAHLEAQTVPEVLERRLQKLLTDRKGDLAAEDDSWRQSVRDILRNGRYKPTGRGKPASEYLLRSAVNDHFPRINGPVDACNYISLKSLLPVSLWDLDLAGTDEFEFRLGREGESYVFNQGGQTIELADLLVGCARASCGGDSLPIVNPVKDSMQTKTTPDSRRIAAMIYGRRDDGPTGTLQSLCEEFGELLSACGTDAESTHGIVRPGETIRI